MNSSVTLDERGLVLPCPGCGQHNRLVYGQLGSAFRCTNCQNPLDPPRASLAAPSAVVFETLIARSAWPVLVDFWAAWCGPCRMLAPEVEKVAADQAGRLLVVNVDTEMLQDTAARYSIRALPTLVLFRGGQEVRRQSGMMPASAILQFLQPAA